MISHADNSFLMWLIWANPGMLESGNVRCFDTAIANLPSESAIIEVGSFCGLSTNLILYLKMLHGKSNPVYCSDAWDFTPQGLPMAGLVQGHPSLTYGEYTQFVRESFVRNVRFFSSGDLPYAIPLFSDDFFENWSNRASATDLFGRLVQLGGPIGFAYIDGNHDYEHSQRDFAHVDEHLEVGGYILFDDSAKTSLFECRHVAMECARNARYELVSRTPNVLVRRVR